MTSGREFVLTSIVDCLKADLSSSSGGFNSHELSRGNVANRPHLSTGPGDKNRCLPAHPIIDNHRGLAAGRRRLNIEFLKLQEDLEQRGDRLILQSADTVYKIIRSQNEMNIHAVKLPVHSICADGNKID